VSNTLLPCPFCGGNDIQIDEMESFWDKNETSWRVLCIDCIAETAGDTKEQAIAAWNRRADARQLALKTRVCPMCEDCPDGCPVETPKDSRNIVTNADRIRGMNDEELAEFLRNIRDCGDYEELKFIGGVCMDYVSVIEWLKQPAKEELI
jgi:Lar family restriction alleviation protein